MCIGMAYTCYKYHVSICNAYDFHAIWLGAFICTKDG